MDPQWAKSKMFSRPAVASTSRKRSNSRQRESRKKSKHHYAQSELSEDEKSEANSDNEID